MRKKLEIANLDNPDLTDELLTPEDASNDEIRDGNGATSRELRGIKSSNIKELSLLPDNVASVAPENYIKTKIQEKEPGFFQGVGKGFKVFLDDNTVLSTTKYISENGFNIVPEQMDPNYDPFSDIPEDKLNYVNNYKYANTPEEVARISNRIDKELENKRILSEEVGTGAQLTSGLLAGILDPINLIPVGGEAYKSFQLGKVATGALRTATAGLLSQTAAEGIFQATQETRTMGESATNIASATLLSGILGAGSSLLTKDKFNEVAGKVNKDLITDKANLSIDPATQEVRSVGAKQVVPYETLYQEYLEKNLPTGKQPMSLEEYQNQLESLAPGIGNAAKTITKSLSKANPILRTFNARSIEAKILLQELGTHNMIVGKNEAGIASQQSVEVAIKQWKAGLGESTQSNTNSFKEFKKRTSQEGIATPIKNIADFNIEVSKSLRRGDVSEIPEVAKVAKDWRSKVFDPLKNAAIEEKLLPEDVKPETAVSYLSRLWNRKAVIAKEPELRQIISDKLTKFELPKIEGIQKKELLDLEAKIKGLEINQKVGEEPSKSLSSLREKYSKLNTEHEFHFGDFKENYVKDIVDSILSNLKGEQRFAAVTNYDFKITNRGPLKERTLSFIRDEEVEKFLENDVEKIADRYTKIMGTDVELKRQFGDINFEDRLNKVTEEYEELAAKAKTEVERAKLQKEKQQVLGDLQALRDVMRGIYGTPENPDSIITRGFRVGRQLNYFTKLGGVVLSSLNDPINAISVHGMMRFSQGLGHMIGNLKGVKLNVKEAKRAGNILENVLHSRLASMAEITDPYNSGHSVFERFIDNVQQLGSKLNGLGLWTDTMKSFSSVLTQQRLIKEASKLLNGKIKKSDRTYLAFLGIDENNVKSITNQIEKFGTKEKSLWVANTDKWTDKEAVRLYRNALNQDVDRTIVTPTAGDVPLFMRKDLGKTIGQFKSFTFASTQQVLIRSLQQKDAAALNGMIASIAMGMLIYHVKSLAAGKETSDDPRKWIAEGVDRSGILGVLMEINNIAEKVSRGTVGINPLIGGEIMTRYASRGIVDTLAGPTAGQIKDLASTIGAIASGDIKESDVKAFRRMLPYQNVFYLSGLFNLLETGIDNAVGAE